MIINIKTPEILEESRSIASADLINDYCPEYYNYYILKNILCLFWILALFTGFSSYKKKSRGMIFTFIIMNFIAIIFKAILETTFVLQQGPCNSVIAELTEQWSDEIFFKSKLTGFLFKLEFSQWNTILILCSAISCQATSIYLRKKSFGYNYLEPSSFTIS